MKTIFHLPPPAPGCAIPVILLAPVTFSILIIRRDTSRPIIPHVSDNRVEPSPGPTPSFPAAKGGTTPPAQSCTCRGRGINRVYAPDDISSPRETLHINNKSKRLSSKAVVPFTVTRISVQRTANQYRIYNETVIIAILNADAYDLRLTYDAWLWWQYYCQLVPACNTSHVLYCVYTILTAGQNLSAEISPLSNELSVTTLPSLYERLRVS